jgi:hypothetical protein
MAKNLKKFVNLAFLKTIDLTLMRRLLERHEAHLSGLDLTIFDQKPGEVRKALQNFFAGPEEGYSKGLTADLHRIAELANQTGLRLLLERADAAKVELIPKSETEGEGHHLNPTTSRFGPSSTSQRYSTLRPISSRSRRAAHSPSSAGPTRTSTPR